MDGTPHQAAATVVRSGGLTWSQQEWVQWVPADSDTSFEDNIWGVLPGAGAPLDRVTAAVRDVLEKHEGLRTTVERAAGRQHVHPVDERLDEVVRVTDIDPALDAAWRRGCYRVGKQWPLTIVLYAPRGMVERIGVVVDHVAIDPWGLAVLRRELIQAIRARAAGRPGEDPVREPVQQPIDVAAEEMSAAGLAYQQRAQRYWGGQLHRLANAIDDGPARTRPAAKPDSGLLRFRSACLPSRRAGIAAQRIAEGTGVSPAAAFLLAFGIAVCEVEESPSAGIFVISANRLTAAAATSVRKATMTMPVVVDRAPASFRTALAECAVQQLHGHRFANADPAVTEAMCRQILQDRYETGVAYPRFSYLTGAAGADTTSAWAAYTEAFPAADGGIVTFGRPRSLGARYMLTVSHDRHGALLDLHWSDETGWGAVAEQMLLQMEELLVSAEP